MAITNIMSFEIGFRNLDTNEIEMMRFGGVAYDKATIDDASDVALNHFVSKLQPLKEFARLSPVMKTFRCISDTVPSDLGLR